MYVAIRLATALLAATPLAGAAQPHVEEDHVDHGPGEHVPLRIDDSIGWDALLERALTNYPRYVELEARAIEAEALRRRGRSLFAGRPTLALGYRSDDPLDDYGFAEYDSGVSLSLWRFGERRAAGRIGETATDEAAAAAAALRWEVAGALRTVLWDIEDAQNSVEVAADALELATEIERVVARRHELGDLPLEDTLLAEATVLERRAALIERQAELVDAEFAYQLLTSLDARPPAFVEPPTERRDFSESHPLLRLAEARVERARAELGLAAREAKGSPSLLIGPRRQRDALTPYYVDSIGAEVAVPFGGEAHVAAQTAAARRSLAEAESERAATERELHAALHEALHTLETATSALALAERRAEIAVRHRNMGRTAFEQGEISLVELLRRDEAARLAASEARAFKVQRARAIAEVNQAVGVLP